MRDHHNRARKCVSAVLTCVLSANVTWVTAAAAEAPTTPPWTPLVSPVISPLVPVATPTPPRAVAPTVGAPGSSSKGSFLAQAAAAPTVLAAGRTPGTFAVSNSGAAAYTIPLWMPPGIGALQLQLALTYSSRGLNGVMGLGWSLSGLSAISRCNKTWAQDGAPAAVTYTASDRFCLDGQQLKLVSGTYGAAGSVYATEIESFARVEALGVAGNGPESFRVTSKNGLVSEYGGTGDSRIEAGNGTLATVRTWALSKLRDRAGGSVGNEIRISYTEDAINGTYRVSEINYPYTSMGAGPFYTVSFAYSARPITDIPGGYLAGYAVREANQLDSITIQNYQSATPTKVYYLTYAQGTTTNRLRLASVQECAAANCFPATTFAYQNGQNGWTTSAASLGVTTANASLVLPIDLNGDGVSDLVYPVASGGGYNWNVVYGSAAGTFSAAQWTGIWTQTYDALIPADIAGRGRTDLLYPSGGYWYRLYWNGSGLSTAATNALLTTPQGPTNAATTADVNGDGLPDLVWTNNDNIVGNGGQKRIYVQLNTTPPGGTVSFSTTPVEWYLLTNLNDVAWSFIAGSTVGYWAESQSINIADFNGDGRADIMAHLDRARSTGCAPQLVSPLSSPPSIQGDPTATSGVTDASDGSFDGGVSTQACVVTHTYYWKLLVSTGTSFVEAASIQQPSPSLSLGLIDWNGDGCTDIFGPQSGYATHRVFLASCLAAGGFGLNIDSGIAYTSIALAGDWDGDGRQDLLAPVSGVWNVIRSAGNAGAATPVSTGVSVGNGAWFFIDAQGDGLMDLAWADQAASNTLKLNPRLATDVTPDLATSFTDGFLVNQSPTYRSIARNNYSRYSDAVFPEADMAGPLQVVDQFTASDGTGSTYQNQFWYYGGRMELQGRGFEGFYAQRIYDTRTGFYTYDYVHRAFPYSGMFWWRDVYNGSPWQMVSQTATNPSYQVSGGSGYQQRFFPYVSSQTDSQYELGGPQNGNLITQQTTSTSYGDGYGNPTSISVSTTDKDNGSPFLNQTWTTTTTNTFANDPSTNWCLGLPATSSVQSAAPGQTTQTRSYSYGSDASACRMTQQVIEPLTPALKVTTTLSYAAAACGNVSTIAVTGANPNGSAMATRTTQFAYGARCQLPEAITNALNQQTTIAYNYAFGVPSSVTDPNNITTNWQHDEYGRRTLENRADLTSTAWSYNYCNTPPCWGDNTLRFLIIEYPRDTAGNNINVRELFYDALDRLKYDEWYRLGAVWTVDIRNYDSLGREIVYYLPGNYGANGWRSTNYDPLGRPTSVSLVKGNGTVDRTTTITYAGRTTSVTNPLSNTTSRVSDVLGRLRRVIDPSPGGTTYYDYDAFGNLNRIQDPIGAVSSGTYNLRGFQTQWADADRGTWTLSPNSLGEIVSWTDAKAQSFSAVFDELGRMKSRTEPEGTSVWTWGTIASGAWEIGRLRSVTGPGYSESLTYDNKGRLSNRTITTDQAYPFDYTYGPTGAVETITYPASPTAGAQTAARFKLQYGYSYGQLREIKDGNTGATYWYLSSTNDYDSATGESLGNGVTITSGYTPWTNELTSLQAIAGATTRQQLAYTWNKNGSLTNRSDALRGLSETFGYDTLDRLTTVTGPAPLTMGYDASGNITSKSDVGTYVYGNAAHPHGVTSAGGRPISYDANGNVTSRASSGSSIGWASFNLPISVTDPTGFSSQIAYGPEHQRLQQTASGSDGTAVTRYVGGLLEKVAAGTATYWRHYIATPTGEIIVSRNSDTAGANSTSTKYVLTDHLGSSDAVLDASGNLLVAESFDAWGNRRVGATWTGYPAAADQQQIANTTRDGFTGHEMLDMVKLVHMGGRVYDPVLGRTLSVDPLIGDVGDSQQINPYSYVGNRPTAFTDPTGLLTVCVNNCNYGPPSAPDVPEGQHGFIPGTNLGSFEWWHRVLRFGCLFGCKHHAPPSPIALPGPSSQGGLGLCAPGKMSVACGGNVLYQSAASPAPSGAASSGVFSSPSADHSEPGIGGFILESNDAIAGTYGRGSWQCFIWEVVAGGYVDTANDVRNGDFRGASISIILATIKPLKVVEKGRKVVGAAKSATSAAKVFSKEKQALIDMAKADKRVGVTREDMRAYEELNRSLPDPLPANKVRVDEGHLRGAPHSQVPHGHVGPVDHIPIVDP